MSRFGPPRGLTRASTWPWIDHSASGLHHATMAPYSDSVSLRLRDDPLTLPRNVTRRLILQKARRHSPLVAQRLAPTVCRHTVSGAISLPSRGTFHLSLTVLVHYRSPGSF